MNGKNVLGVGYYCRKMKNNKIIIWSTGVVRLIEGKPIDGLAVQMYFWAQVFADNGWKVFSFAENAKKTVVLENIVFRPLRNIQRLNILFEWWYALKYLVVIRPKIVVYRGESRNLLALSLVSRLLGVKLVYFSASDSNFEPDKNPVGSKLGFRMYQQSIKYIRYFVTQNRYQHDTLLLHYGKGSLVQYNIWGQTAKCKDNPPESDAAWVANLRKLKRAEWALNAAEKLPNYQFVIAGGRTGESGYYDAMQQRAEQLQNVSFLGGRPFSYANELVGKARVLLCTSTYEGFPNTFLQAWSAGIPVISTVDPSGVIKTYQLGVVVSNEAELQAALERVLGDKEYCNNLQQSVKAFFIKNHSAQMGYENVIKYIEK